MSKRLLVHLYVPFELWARLEARKATGQPKWGVIQDVLDSEEKQREQITSISQERYDLQDQLKKTQSSLSVTTDIMKLLITRLAQYEDTSTWEKWMK